jgi:hypothetical protein
MATIKPALKAAKTAVDSKKWDEAIVQAQKVLTVDDGNYFAYDFFTSRLFDEVCS